MPKCITCPKFIAKKYTEHQHCWRHKQCGICHYFGKMQTVTMINPRDDYRRY